LKTPSATPDQIPHDRACEHESRRRRDKRDRARGALAVERFAGELVGKDDLRVLDAALFELPAHHARERADVRLGDIRDAEPGRVELVAGAHRADDGRAGAVRAFDQQQLRCDLVDRVGDVVVGREVELSRGFAVEEHVARLDIRHGIDPVRALAHDLRLGPADRIVRRDDLAIEVCDVDAVAVDERERAYARAHERLGREAADAADAEHDHFRAAELFLGLYADQTDRPLMLLHAI